MTSKDPVGEQETGPSWPWHSIDADRSFSVLCAAQVQVRIRWPGREGQAGEQEKPLSPGHRILPHQKLTRRNCRRMHHHGEIHSNKEIVVCGGNGERVTSGRKISNIAPTREGFKVEPPEPAFIADKGMRSSCPLGAKPQRGIAEK